MSRLRITGVFELVPVDFCLTITFSVVFLATDNRFLRRKKIKQHTVLSMAETNRKPTIIRVVSNSNRWEDNLEDRTQDTKHDTAG